MIRVRVLFGMNLLVVYEMVWLFFGNIWFLFSFGGLVSRGLKWVGLVVIIEVFCNVIIKFIMIKVILLWFVILMFM